MDEKLKHRLIGLAVIISLGAIFAPAMIKKSNQPVENHFSVKVQLPPKPSAPNVVMTDEKETFKTIKIAKVDIAPVSEKKQLPELVKAERIKSDVIDATPQEVAQVKPAQPSPGINTQPIKVALNEKATNTAKKVLRVAAVKPIKRIPVHVAKLKAMPKPIQVARVVKPVVRKPVIKTDLYALQIASFSQLTNAQTLVNKLRRKGYKASLTTTRGGQGAVYKVLVGHSPSRTDVVRLKSQLASAMQLNGFIVNTRVS